MVEKLNETEPDAREIVRNWRALWFEREAGTPTREIAERLGLTYAWVRDRLAMEARSMPKDGPGRLAARLEYLLIQAEGSIATDPAAAERTAKVVLAMTRAAEAVAAFSAQNTVTEAGADNERTDYRAELERRLARIIDARGESGVAASHDGGGAGADSS